MERSEKTGAPERRAPEKYQQPLLIKHEPLIDITGAKYLEKELAEKTGFDKGQLET